MPPKRTPEPDVGGAEISPAPATRGKRATSSTATRTGRSRQSTDPATSKLAPVPGRVSVPSGREGSGLRSDDTRTALVALRDALADSLEAADASVAAQIAGQLRAVYKDLAALGDPETGDLIDELAARRAADRPPEATRRSSTVRRG